MQKFKALLAKYGQFALVVHLLLYAFVFSVFFFVVEFGFRERLIQFVHTWIGEEYAGAGTVLLTFALTKITQPFRLMLLVPLVPFLKHRWDGYFFKEGFSEKESSKEKLDTEMN